jgi:outer membrane protein assembly factor BamB
VVSRGFAYGADSAGMLFAFDRRGEPVWSYDLRGPVLSRATVVGENVFVASADGRLFSFSESR